MTAQAPYESPVTDAMAKALLNAMFPYGWADPWMSTAKVAIAAALAALPERAPVSAGGDAGGWPDYLMLRDTKLHDDAGGLGQRIFTTAGAGYEKRKYVRADLAATPAPPVGADWDKSYREQVPQFREKAWALFDLFLGVPLDEVKELAAAPTPAEARGVGDGDALLARAYEVVHHDTDCPAIGGNGDDDCRCDAVPFLRDLRAALAANKPAGEEQ